MTCDSDFVTLLTNGRTVAYLGLLPEGRSITLLSSPVILDHVEHEARTLILSNLIRQAVTNARDCSVSELRMILPADILQKSSGDFCRDDETGTLISTLQQFGFQNSAEIQEWSYLQDPENDSTDNIPRHSSKTSLPQEHSDDSPFSEVCSLHRIDVIPAADLLSSTRLSEKLCELLTAIRVETQDLPEFAPDDPATTLRQWISSECRILLAHSDESLTGLCVFDVHDGTLPSSDTSASGVHLRYIGVHPDKRRQGIATAMLRQLIPDRSPRHDVVKTIRTGLIPPGDPGFISMSTRQRPPLISISVHSDQTNLPANSLYRSLGFIPERILSIWRLRIDTDPTPDEIQTL